MKDISLLCHTPELQLGQNMRKYRIDPEKPRPKRVGKGEQKGVGV